MSNNKKKSLDCPNCKTALAVEVVDTEEPVNVQCACGTTFNYTLGQPRVAFGFWRWNVDQEGGTYDEAVEQPLEKGAIL